MDACKCESGYEGYIDLDTTEKDPTWREFKARFVSAVTRLTTYVAQPEPVPDLEAWVFSEFLLSNYRDQFPVELEELETAIAKGRSAQKKKVNKPFSGPSVWSRKRRWLKCGKNFTV